MPSGGPEAAAILSGWATAQPSQLVVLQLLALGPLVHFQSKRNPSVAVFVCNALRLILCVVRPRRRRQSALWSHERLSVCGSVHPLPVEYVL